MRFYRLLLISSILLSIYSLNHAQSLVKEGHQWNVAEGSFWSSRVTTELTKIVGDTIINDTVYKKLYSTMDTLDTNWKLRAEFLREDSVGKVYTRNAISGQEDLLFDFSLQVNDTFSIYLGSYASPDFECLAIVSDIDSIVINNGEKRKRIHSNIIRNNSLSQGPTLIEGIGSMNGGLFGDIRYCIFDIVIGLNCFYDNEELLFPEAPTDCFIDIPVSVENILPEDISIYPNPISDQLNIKHGSTELEKISILNLSGIEIYEGPYTASVDVSSLAPGAYILLLQSTDGRTFTQNLIKLN